MQVLVATSFIFGVWATGISKSFAGKKGEGPSAEELLVPECVDADKVQLRTIKSNPKHFVRYFREKVGEIPKEITIYKGLVFGDSHTYNFGDLHFSNPNEKKSEPCGNEPEPSPGIFGPIDFDDFHADIPLIFGLIKKLTTDEAAFQDQIKKLDIYGSYLKGLQDAIDPQEQARMSPPTALSVAINTNFCGPKGALERMSKEARKKSEIIDGRLKFKSLTKDEAKLEGSILPPELWPKSVDQEFIKSGDFFSKILTDDKYQVLDIGYSTRASGSSANMMRFLFLVQRGGNPYLFEFKEKAPVTEEVNSVTKTQDPIGVFNLVDQIYFKRQVVREYLDVVQAPSGKHYEKRMRGNNLVKIEKESDEQIIATSLYEAYWEGYIAAQQSPDFGAALLSLNGEVVSEGDSQIRPEFYNKNIHCHPA